MDLLVNGELFVNSVYRFLDCRKLLIARHTLGKLGIGIDDRGDNNLFALVFLARNHYGFRNDVLVRKVLLKLLGEYVFAVGKNDNVLFAAGDVDVVVAVDISDVARSEPAVLGKYLASCFFVFVITHHDVVALDEYFAGIVSAAVVNAYHASVYGLTDRSGTALAGAVNCYEGSAFGNAVALEYCNVKAVEFADKLGGQGSAAAYDRAEIAAERVADLGEDLVAKVKSDCHRGVAELHCKLDLFAKTLFVYLVPDTLAHRFNVQGNYHDGGRLCGVDGTDSVLYAVVDIQSNSAYRCGELTAGHLVGVVQRQKVNEHVLVIVFGETIPKISAKNNANTTAMNNSGFIYVLMTVLKPLIRVVVSLVELITKPMKEVKSGSDDEESVEELHSIIDTAEDEGVLDPERTEIVQAAIDFNDISAFEVMTARVDIDAINVEDSIEEIMEQIQDSPYSRFPVYEDSIDNVIGTLHLNHLLRAMTDEEPVDLRALLMPPCFVYKTMKLPKVLNTLKTAKQHLAIVTDEYSGTLGVISMEDVLEQIVGDIWDETDKVEPEVVKVNESSYELDGDMIIDDFLELTGINAEEFDFESDTVGGFCIEYLEKFPKEGDHFVYEEYEIVIREVDDRRVTKVLVKKLPK